MALLLSELEAKAREFVGLENEDNAHGQPYFAPSDEPLQWKTDGQMVRLDVAINAIHIFAARIAFRTFPGAIRQRLVKLQTSVRNFVERKVIIKALGKAGGQVLDTLNTIRTVFDAIEAQKEIEGAIRRQSIKIQRDLKGQYLGKGKRRRKKRTQLVWSRNKDGR